MKTRITIKTMLFCTLLLTLILSSQATAPAHAQFSGCTTVTEIPQTECQGLVALFSNTNGAYWTILSGWWLTTTPCSWYGITCSGGHVTQIRLNGNGLTGIIPPEIGNLTNLTYFNVEQNQLSGSIPSQVGSLTNLTFFSVAVNQLSGSIPIELTNLTNLQYLYLSLNQFTGTIPPQLGNLTNLKELGLNHNQLSGTIPSQLGNLTNLQILSLQSNQLNGSVPTEFGNLVNLTQLLLRTNQLTGSLPTSLTSLTSLTSFYFESNSLCEPSSSTFQTWLSGITNLGRTNVICGFSCSSVTEIPVAECNELVTLYNSTNGPGWTNKTGWLTTNTPCSWYGITCSAAHVTQIILGSWSGGNNLLGTIPDLNLPHLTILDLPRNQLTGTIPNFTNLPNLTTLDIHGNQLTGTIPNFTNLPNLTFFNLDANQVSGAIPNFTNLPNLQTLYLFHNLLSGTIPNLNWSSFTSISLSQNCGLVAFDAAQATVLTSKDASWQTLNPACPATPTPTATPPTFSCSSVTEIPVAECNDLVTLYNSTNGSGWTDKTGWLTTNTPCSWYGIACSGGHVTRIILGSWSGGNNLLGTIPDLNLPNLTVLSLDSNQLSGSVPNFSNLPNLQGLHLDSNQLSGSIPNFSNLPNLQELHLLNNQLSGSIPNFSNLPNLTDINLCSNQLSGSVPNFSNLPNLQKLDLCYNQLSGSVPNFSNLSNLTYLRLYSNQLSGSVPNFSNLPNLRELYLDSNQLSGSVPNFSNLSNLTYLRLDSNQLSGSVPNFSNLPNLTDINLGSNQLSGSVPNFSNLPNLRELYLHSNQLSGSIPNFSNLPILSWLFLHSNQLSGTIPNLNWSSFSALSLNNNCGLVAFDAAQATVLTSRDPNWQTLNPACPATPTPTATATTPLSATATATLSATATVTLSATATATISATATPSATPTSTATPFTPSVTPSTTPSHTPTPTPTATNTATATATPTSSATATSTATATPNTKTFQVPLDGLSFSNFKYDKTKTSDAIKWEQFKKTFPGTSAELPDGQRRKSAETYFYSADYQDIGWGGNCAGFTAVSLIRYLGLLSETVELSLLSANNRAVTQTSQLGPKPAIVIQYDSKYGGNRPFVLAGTSDIADYIHLYQARQMSFQSAVWYTQHRSDTPQQTYQAIKNSTQANVPVKVSVRAGGMGHAMVAYRTVDNGNMGYIYVYDNNYPNDTNRRIEVDLTANSWKYDIGGSIWSATGGNLMYYPATLNFPAQAFQSGTSGPIQRGDIQAYAETGHEILINASGEVNLLITDSQGHQLGYQNGQFVDTIPGAAHLLELGYNPDTPDAKGVESFFLPASEGYKVSIQPLTTTSVYTLTAFGNGSAMRLENIAVATNTTDSLVLGQSVLSTTFKPATDSSYCHSVTHEEADSSRDLTSCVTGAANSAVSFGLNATGEQLTISNGSNQAINVTTTIDQVGAGAVNQTKTETITKGGSAIVMVTTGSRTYLPLIVK